MTEYSKLYRSQSPHSGAKIMLLNQSYSCYNLTINSRDSPVMENSESTMCLRAE